MDILKAEIARKRKLLEQKNLVDDKKKYFKRGELIAKEQEEYYEKYGHKIEEIKANTGVKIKAMAADDVSSEVSNLPRNEIVRRLRERGEPIMLFGELELDAFRRLRQCEITEPEINRGFRNDFQEAMEQVDQAYLEELLASGSQQNTATEKQTAEDLLLDDSVTYDALQEMSKKLGRGNKDHDMHVITSLLQFILKTWHNQLNSYSGIQKITTKVKIMRATFTQTRDYMKPLFRKLKNKNLPEDILDSLTDIAKYLLQRNYIMASDSYLTMAIGNAPWPIGVTMVGIHARTGREKIFSKNVAHVMNDETQRKYIQGLKRLMTKCQDLFPTDPSRCVEYVSKKDLIE